MSVDWLPYPGEQIDSWYEPVILRRGTYELKQDRDRLFPHGFQFCYYDTVTNARLKQYLDSSVLQVSNDKIFPAGAFEKADGRKRLYDVPAKGSAADPDRSREESKRRAKSKVRDIALCNRFTHMFTWTLDPQKIDRYDPDEVYKRCRTFLSNMTQRKGFEYVIQAVQERMQRENGSYGPQAMNNS